MGGDVLADDSGNRRDGSVQGATFRNDGRFGGALHFLPGDSVTVDRFPNATSSWTFSGWVRIGEEDVVSEDFGTIVTTEAMFEGGWQFQSRARSSGIYWSFAYWLEPSNSYAHFECHCFELGRWSHATVVLDAARNELSFYIDGQRADASSLPGPILPGTSALSMGTWAG